MRYTPRPYQTEVVNRMLQDVEKTGNSLICLPTGSGKSVVISEFARKFGKPILIFQPNREILEQNYEKIKTWTDDVGIYSASLNSKEIKNITLATIGSTYKKPEDFSHFEVVIQDECHLINPENIDTMYRKFFEGAGTKKVFGLSATIFRQAITYNRSGGWAGYTGATWQKIKEVEAITTTKMITRFKPYKGKWFWSKVLAIINVDKATEKGYLTPLKYIDDSMVHHEQLKLNKSRSDFDIEEFEKTCSQSTKIVEYINAIEQKKILVFCSSIAQASALAELGNYFVVTADTKPKERKQIIEQFREAKRGVLCGVNIFSYGMDIPDLEAIVLLRPCRSLALYSQVLGRLTRLKEGKEFGYVYDLVGNVRAMGRLDTIKTTYIDGKLNVISETKPEGWHDEPLFTWRIKPKGETP